MVSMVFQMTGLDLIFLIISNVSINSYDFSLTKINCGIPQGFVLGPLLLLLYINDLNQAIKFCKVNHFTDDTNLLYLGKSIKKLNKFVSIDLKNLVNLLNANLKKKKN